MQEVAALEESSAHLLGWEREGTLGFCERHEIGGRLGGVRFSVKLVASACGKSAVMIG